LYYGGEGPSNPGGGAKEACDTPEEDEPVTTPRRRRIWADRVIDLLITSGGQTIPIDLLVDLPEDDVKTVTCIIGRITSVYADPDGALTTSQRIDMGIGVASREAFTAGIVPDPATQADYPTQGWLWIDSPTTLKVNASGTTEAFHVPVVTFDVGAQRKVDKGVLYFVADNTLIVGSAASIRIVGRIRALVLL